MKTRFIKQTIQFSMLIALVVFAQSCDTEIPPEDLTPPKFSFQIHGDGFYHVFNQDSDYDDITLNLKTGANYEFTFSAADNGGLAGAVWSRDDIWKVRITSRVQSPWSQYYGHNSIYGSINWQGERTNPLTGAQVTGNFEVRDEGNDSTEFNFNAVDFGGLEGMPNRIQKSLQIRISDSPTRILP